MVSEIFSGKSKSVEANKEGSFEIFEENQTKKNKNPLKNQIRKICLNERVKNLQRKEEINQEEKDQKY